MNPTDTQNDNHSTNAAPSPVSCPRGVARLRRRRPAPMDPRHHAHHRVTARVDETRSAPATIGLRGSRLTVLPGESRTLTR